MSSLFGAHTCKIVGPFKNNICTANGCASTITIELRESSMSRKMSTRIAFSSRLRCSMNSSLCDLIYLFAMAIEILISELESRLHCSGTRLE